MFGFTTMIIRPLFLNTYNKHFGTIWCYTGDLDKAQEVFKPYIRYGTFVPTR
jgi:hypothetical protein